MNVRNSSICNVVAQIDSGNLCLFRCFHEREHNVLLDYWYTFNREYSRLFWSPDGYPHDYQAQVFDVRRVLPHLQKSSAEECQAALLEWLVDLHESDFRRFVRAPGLFGQH